MLTAQQLTLSLMLVVCLVPLLVRHELSNCIVKTFVLPNNCSQATFTRNKFLDLGLHGRKTSITVKTMNGEMTKSP